MDISRRQTLQAAVVAAVGGALGACGTKDSSGPAPHDGRAVPAGAKRAGGWRLPDEAQPHEATYMAWPTRRIWGPEITGVRDDIARIARTIAEFEPVALLANDEEAQAARRACGSGVEVVPAPVDDLWMRDTGPVFVLGPDGVAGVDLHFNGWGNKQEHGRDSRVARAILDDERLTRIKAPITAEGGAVEGDGRGTLMVTESSLVNDNRNPGMSREDIERELKELFGATTVIWVKGVKGKDITDYHIDALARFSEPGVVVLSTPAKNARPNEFTGAYEQARRILDRAVDAREAARRRRAARTGRHRAPREGVPGLLCELLRGQRRGRHAPLRRQEGRQQGRVPAAGAVSGTKWCRCPSTTSARGGGIDCSTQQSPKAG